MVGVITRNNWIERILEQCRSNNIIPVGVDSLNTFPKIEVANSGKLNITLK